MFWLCGFCCSVLFLYTVEPRFVSSSNMLKCTLDLMYDGATFRNFNHGVYSWILWWCNVVQCRELQLLVCTLDLLDDGALSQKFHH